MTKACRGDMCYCMLSVQVPCSNEQTSFPLHFYICYFLFLVKALKINSSMHHYANPIVLPLIDRTHHQSKNPSFSSKNGTFSKSVYRLFLFCNFQIKNYTTSIRFVLAKQFLRDEIQMVIHSL